MASLADLFTGLLGAGASIYSANKQANAVQDAAAQAAQASQFRPVGITTRFGRSGFQYDPATGQLTGAGYQVAPDVAAMREGLLGLAGGQLSQAQQAQGFMPDITRASTGLFNLGQQFLPTSTTYAASPESNQYANFLRQQAAAAAPSGFAATPTAASQQYANQLAGIAGAALPTSFEGQAAPEAQALYNKFAGTAAQIMPTSYDTQAAAQRYIQQQQGLLAPQREQQLAQIRNQLQQTGRAGLATGATAAGGRAATNPEMAAYYNAIAQQDAQLAANAEQQARANLQSDIGLASQLGTTGLGALTSSRQQAAQQALQRAQFGTGLIGAGYGATTAAGQQNLANALQLGQFASGQMGTALQAQQNAEEIARQRMLSNLQVGQGLFGNALNLQGAGYGLQTQALAPFTNYLAGAGNIENMGLQALTQGTGLGSAITAGATNAAMIQQQAANQAAQLAATRNQAVVGGLQDPVAALIGALTR